MFEGKHVLIIVENLPVPFDRRVWQEANTLKEHGAYVSIICPKMKGYIEGYEIINGIEIFSSLAQTPKTAQRNIPSDNLLLRF